MQHEDVAERADLQNAEAAEGRRPHVLPRVPGAGRELVVAEALAALEHEDAIALLRQPERRDAAAETRTDDDVVEDLGHGGKLAEFVEAVRRSGGQAE
jgi:hypothetical protein